MSEVDDGGRGDSSASRVKTILLGFAAVTEVVALLVLGGLFMRWAGNALSLESYRAVADSWQPGDAVAWGQLAVHETIRHALRYGPIFGISFAWGYWRFGYRGRDYGLTVAGKPLRYHVLWGLELFALIGLPTKFIVAWMQSADLGEGPAHWAMLESGSGPGFWVFMAVSSYALPPLFEELYLRGYAQTRLTGVMGPAGAIGLLSVLFAAAHTQYYALEATSLTMLALIFVAAVANGVARHVTGSLLAPILAHVLVNLPIGV